MPHIFFCYLVHMAVSGDILMLAQPNERERKKFSNSRCFLNLLIELKIQRKKFMCRVWNGKTRRDTESWLREGWRKPMQHPESKCLMLIDIEWCIWPWTNAAFGPCLNVFRWFAVCTFNRFYLNGLNTSYCALHTTHFIHRMHVAIADRKRNGKTGGKK